MIASANGDSVTEEALSGTIQDVLRDSEQPHHIFRMLGVLKIDGSSNGSAITAVDKTRHLIVSDQRMIILEEDEQGYATESIHLSDTASLDFTSSWWTGTKIQIESADHIYRSGLHKKTSKSELKQAKSFVRATEFTPSSDTESEPDDEHMVSRTATLKNIEVEEAFQTKIGTGRYQVRVSPENLKFERQKIMGSAAPLRVSTDDINFAEIEISTERDFDVENRSRYVNMLNPLVADAADPKKANQNIIKLPFKSGGHLLLSVPRVGTTRFEQLLNSIARIDPRDPGEQMSDNVKEVPENESSPLETLKQRLAAGEISVEEYEELKETIEE